ncbi:hypothetical protein D3C71_182040 [compost metagenome]
MSLAHIVSLLGGDLYDGGRRALVAAPGHSRADRSVSLLFDGTRLIIHGFGATDWRMVRDHLQAQGLIDGRNRLCAAGVGGAPVREIRARGGARRPVQVRVWAAQALWAEARPLQEGDLVNEHLRRRSVSPPKGGKALRFHPAAPLSVYQPDRRACPAMMAGVQAPDGRLTSVEVLYLAAGGRVARLALPRKLVGLAPTGSAVRLMRQGETMLVGEGVVTTLSAMARFNLPGWALLSAGNLARWTPPEAARRILIAGDRGVAGQAAALRLQARLIAMGLEARVRLPPSGFGDWNDAAMQKGREEGRGGAPTRRG